VILVKDLTLLFVDVDGQSAELLALQRFNHSWRVNLRRPLIFLKLMQMRIDLPKLLEKC
jgi:hypothetical protein